MKIMGKIRDWDKYRETMFITEIDEQHANDKRTNALKPMNCPCHVQLESRFRSEKSPKACRIWFMSSIRTICKCMV